MHRVTGSKLYVGVMEAVGDDVDEDDYEIIGVTSWGASANPTCNIKEDGGTAFNYSDGTTATLHLVVKEKEKEVANDNLNEFLNNSVRPNQFHKGLK